MSVQVVTIESSSESRVLGVYLTPNLAKASVLEFVKTSEMSFKKKLMKKEDLNPKKLMFLQDVKEEGKTHIYVTDVPFVMPVGKGKKSKKDPNAPKRNMSAFMLYSNAHRNPIKEANPTATFGEIGRLLGQSWSTLDADTKASFTTMSETGKREYLVELAKYNGETAEEVELEEVELEVVEPEVVEQVKAKKGKKVSA